MYCAQSEKGISANAGGHAGTETSLTVWFRPGGCYITGLGIES